MYRFSCSSVIVVCSDRGLWGVRIDIYTLTEEGTIFFIPFPLVKI
jgi:hypothetical protein